MTRSRQRPVPSLKASLYICYQSLLDPLTQTQVVAYLEGLSQAGYTILLLTFEPRPLTEKETIEWRARMLEKGIRWQWLRYHKSPTLPATAWDISAGIVTALKLTRRHNVQLIHARSHIPGLMGLVVKRLTGVKLLFDVRGFMGEEYVDAGVWTPNGLLFRLIKRAERAIVKRADGIVVLTSKARETLRDWYPQLVNDKPLYVIPCCVDRRFISTEQRGKSDNPETDSATLVYVGKLGGWYLDSEMVDFVATAGKIVPKLRWQVWTQSDPNALLELVRERKMQEWVEIGMVAHEQVAHELAKAAVGLSFVKPCFSKRAASPTKVGEYIAAGLPVVSTAGIGDLDDLLQNGEQGPVGVVVNELTPDGYVQAAHKLKMLLDEPNIRERCREVAAKHLDLETVGWQRYREMYQILIGS